jgi:hypothetical protein
MKQGAPVGGGIRRVGAAEEAPGVAVTGTWAGWHAACKFILNPSRSTTIDTRGNRGIAGAVADPIPQKNRQRRLEPQGFRRFFLLLKP